MIAYSLRKAAMTPRLHRQLRPAALAPARSQLSDGNAGGPGHALVAALDAAAFAARVGRDAWPGPDARPVSAESVGLRESFGRLLDAVHRDAVLSVVLLHVGAGPVAGRPMGPVAGRRRPVAIGRPAWVSCWSLGRLAVASLFFFNFDHRYENWIVYFYSMFFLGSLGLVDARAPHCRSWAAVGLRPGDPGPAEYVWGVEIAIALWAGMTIYVVGRLGHLTDWLAWRPLQYLGRISYSLYLIHYPVSHVVVWTGHRLTGDAPWPAVGWTARGGAAERCRRARGCTCWSKRRPPAWPPGSSLPGTVPILRQSALQNGSCPPPGGRGLQARSGAAPGTVPKP